MLSKVLESLLSTMNSTTITDCFIWAVIAVFLGALYARKKVNHHISWNMHLL